MFLYKHPSDKYTATQLENLNARALCRSFMVAAFTSYKISEEIAKNCCGKGNSHGNVHTAIHFHLCCNSNQ